MTPSVHIFMHMPRLWAEKRVEGEKMKTNESLHCPVMVCKRGRGVDGDGLEVGQAFQPSAPKQGA